MAGKEVCKGEGGRWPGWGCTLCQVFSGAHPCFLPLCVVTGCCTSSFPMGDEPAEGRNSVTDIFTPAPVLTWHGVAMGKYLWITQGVYSLECKLREGRNLCILSTAAQQHLAPCLPVFNKYTANE